MYGATQILTVASTNSAGSRLARCLWRTCIGAGAGAAFLLSLAWLCLAGTGETPASTWWKSLLSLSCFLVATYVWRVALRLDVAVVQGWTFADLALVLAGAFITSVFVLRGSAAVAALLIVAFLAQEGLSLWRLNLLPKRFMRAAASRDQQPAGFPLSGDQIIPIQSRQHATSTPIEAGLPESDEPSISQQFTRREDAEGCEIRGFVRGKFEATELITSLDIAFCPTLNGKPTLDFEVTCEEELKVQVATLQPFGARLELKRKSLARSELAFAIELHVACASAHSIATVSAEST